MAVKLDRDFVENTSYQVVHDNTIFQGIFYSERQIIPMMTVASTKLGCNVVYPDGTPCPWSRSSKTPLPIAIRNSEITMEEIMEAYLLRV